MRRFCAALVVAVTFGAVLIAQVPGRNVNMVSGTTWPNGDPYLQRQNEPTIAASTRNPLHLLAGANDYRTVDLPGLPNGGITGDAWLGLFKSFDGGQRWQSTLIPGYPQDRSAVGLASPLKSYQAAADPVVRAGTSGLFYYAGLAFNRSDTGSSAIFVARFIDNNNKENGDPVPFLGTSIVATDSGATGGMLDKPWLAVDIPRGTDTCVITAPGDNGHTITETIPAGPAYVAYTKFSGSGTSLQATIMFSHSTDCGKTWSAPIALSGTTGIHQGPTIAIDPKTGNVYVAWRRFANGTDVDAILVAQSVDFGNKFAGGKEARRLDKGVKNGLNLGKILEHKKPKDDDLAADMSEFDQGSSQADIAFRTNAYPSMTFDNQGRMYLAWTERGYATVRPDPSTGDARVMMSTSTDGSTWTTPRAVAEYGQTGHQIMPSLAFAGGKLLLVYYDLVEDISHTFASYIDDKTAIVTGKRHTMDIRASLGTPGATPVFAQSVKVSDYLFGVPSQGTVAEQLQYNPPNLPMFATGTLPFMGDYIDLTPAPAFVPLGAGKWGYNTSPSSVPVFHAVWTDNRDVRQPADGDWSHYTPPTENNGLVASTFDPTVNQPVCQAGNTGSRNQNIYTSRVTGGLIAGSPGNTKPLSSTLERAFVVFAQNTTGVTKNFRLTILNQPVNGRASFAQFPLPPYTAQSPAPLTVLDVTTPPYSMVSRTAYVTSSDPHALINISVAEIQNVGDPAVLTGGLATTVVLNPDIANPDIANPDIANPDIANPDIANAEVQNPDIANPDIANPDIANPDIANPDIANPDIANITVANPDIANPDIANPDIANPDIANPDIANPDIANPDIANAPITDVTWTITNDGNTTAAYNVNMFLSGTTIPSGIALQLILHKTYLTPTTVGCDLTVQSQNVLVANITNPVFITPNTLTLPDPNRPDRNNATLWLAPGESGKITLRIRDDDPSNNVTVDGASIDPAFVPGVTVTPGVTQQAVDTTDAQGGVTTPPVTTPPGQSTITFLQQPVDEPLGETMPAVSVLVRDATGAVLPGVQVSLSLLNGSGATLIGSGLALSNVAGVATFGGLRVSAIGSGYQLQASVGSGPGLPPPANSATFAVLPLVVTNTASSGPGSLRQAMIDANASAGTIDTISFNIPGPAPHVIAPQLALPEVTDPVVIDATTQPGYAGVPVVTIDGVALGDIVQQAFRLHAGASTVRGLQVVRFSGANGYAFEVRGAGNDIESNFIGTDVGGTAGLGNRIGVLLDTVSNTTVNGNVISGNASDGVLAIGGSNVQISNNRIGTTPDGIAARGNGGNGFTTYNGASLLQLNGNIIAANGGWGIEFQATGCPACTGGATAAHIESNTIGLSAFGSRLGNALGGIHTVAATGTQIGNPATAPNVISANGGAGISIEGPGLPSAPIVVRGNRIGTDSSGTVARGNAGVGMLITAPYVHVGWQVGDPAGPGNLISANGADGIEVIGAAATGVTITGNYIGTNAAGKLALPTDLTPSATWGNFQGIYINGAQGVVVGGSTAQQRNILSGNAVDGVMLQGAATSSNVIEGNYIGTDLTGLKPIGNGWDGIGILGAASNSVLSNILSWNAQRGVYVSGPGNTIAGNLIGVRADAVQNAENATGGILLTSDADGTANNNIIGDPAGTLGNTIADNLGPGINVAAGTGNQILSNSIHDNNGLGIDLQADNEVRANDAGDGDTGPNQLQNWPVLSNASFNSVTNQTTVDYNLDSAASTTFRFQFFVSDTCDASGNGEGATFLAQAFLGTNASGSAAGTFTFGPIAVGKWLTVTVTDPSGNTSEFSNCSQVVLYSPE